MYPIRSPHPSPHHLSPHFKKNNRSKLHIKNSDESRFVISAFDHANESISKPNSTNRNEAMDVGENLNITKTLDEEILSDFGDLSLN